MTAGPHTSCPLASNVKNAYDQAAGASTVTATSPVTNKTYTMACAANGPVVTCTGGIGAFVTFSTSTTPSSTSGTTGGGATSVAVEGPGSTGHATDAEFCSSHSCIANFPNGNGYIVQCQDGGWSHSGSLSGACSDHGGER